MTKASEGIGYLIPSEGIATLELERVSELVKHEIKSLRASLFFARPSVATICTCLTAARDFRYLRNGDIRRFRREFFY